METSRNIFFLNNLADISASDYDDYLAHALCLKGECSFTFNGIRFTMKEGDLLIIIRCRFLEDIEQSEDFEVINMMGKGSFLELCTPSTNYGVMGHISLFVNPVMRLTPEQRKICEYDFEWIQYRLRHTEHHFYKEILINAVQSALIDFFDFHSKLSEGEKIPTSNVKILERFMMMLDKEDYRKHRTVGHYADILCVTPKYLSEICKKLTGFGAHYWIRRYAANDIAQLLRDKSLSIKEISDIFHFSSPAYFSRYVHSTLGTSPSEIRNQRQGKE